MPKSTRRAIAAVSAGLAAATVLAATAAGAAPPVGPLPKGPVSTIQTGRGQLVAIALPDRSGGKVWRVARAFDAKVVRQVSEADVGSSVVLVFRAAGAGTTTVAVALTRGETAKAYEARLFRIRVT